MKEVVLEIWVRQRDAEGESMIVFKAEQTRDEWQKDEQGIRITNERKSIAKEEHRVWDLLQHNWFHYQIYKDIWNDMVPTKVVLDS